MAFRPDDCGQPIRDVALCQDECIREVEDIFRRDRDDGVEIRSLQDLLHALVRMTRAHLSHAFMIATTPVCDRDPSQMTSARNALLPPSTQRI